MGSSPRMRGTLLRGRCSTLRTGIIPAYAGNTVIIKRQPPMAGDHPRVCGEHDCWAYWRVYALGSSPRMRGTRKPVKTKENGTGIIPAYAGNTSAARRREYRRWDHPRVCGEHCASRSNHLRLMGSSPRMRGTHQGWRDDGEVDGIIPAYAGNTRSDTGTSAGARDHPRVCGEHFNAVRSATSPQGSSPRMRGTRFIKNTGACPAGIIPAYAGNTWPYTGGRPSCRDHPRVCGEHLGFELFDAVDWGSSPRMRGTLDSDHGCLVGVGIIPAYAGNTPACQWSEARWRDHPRVCGEHLSCAI